MKKKRLRDKFDSCKPSQTIIEIQIRYDTPSFRAEFRQGISSKSQLYSRRLLTIITRRKRKNAPATKSPLGSAWALDICIIVLPFLICLSSEFIETFNIFFNITSDHLIRNTTSQTALQILFARYTHTRRLPTAPRNSQGNRNLNNKSMGRWTDVYVPQQTRYSVQPITRLCIFAFYVSSNLIKKISFCRTAFVNKIRLCGRSRSVGR